MPSSHQSHYPHKNRITNNIIFTTLSFFIIISIIILKSITNSLLFDNFTSLIPISTFTGCSFYVANKYTNMNKILGISNIMIIIIMVMLFLSIIIYVKQIIKYIKTNNHNDNNNNKEEEQQTKHLNDNIIEYHNNNNSHKIKQTSKNNSNPHPQLQPSYLNLIIPNLSIIFLTPILGYKLMFFIQSFSCRYFSLNIIFYIQLGLVILVTVLLIVQYCYNIYHLRKNYQSYEQLYGENKYQKNLQQKQEKQIISYNQKIEKQLLDQLRQQKIKCHNQMLLKKSYFNIYQIYQNPKKYQKNNLDTTKSSLIHKENDLKIMQIPMTIPRISYKQNVKDLQNTGFQKVIQADQKNNIVILTKNYSLSNIIDKKQINKQKGNIYNSFDIYIQLQKQSQPLTQTHPEQPQLIYDKILKKSARLPIHKNLSLQQKHIQKLSQRQILRKQLLKSQHTQFKKSLTSTPQISRYYNPYEKYLKQDKQHEYNYRHIREYTQKDDQNYQNTMKMILKQQNLNNKNNFTITTTNQQQQLCLFVPQKTKNIFKNQQQLKQLLKDDIVKQINEFNNEIFLQLLQQNVIKNSKILQKQATNNLNKKQQKQQQKILRQSSKTSQSKKKKYHRSKSPLEFIRGKFTM